MLDFNQSYLFGDKNDVAVEIELTKFVDHWVYGKICYWIAGNLIGDYEQGTTFNSTLAFMTTIVKDCGKRFSDELYQLPKHEIFGRIDGALYGGGKLPRSIYQNEIASDILSEIEPSPDEEKSNDEMWGRFDIVQHIDIFDNWKVYLIEKGQNSRFIWKNWKYDEDISEVILPIGEFDSAIKKAFEFIDDIFD